MQHIPLPKYPAYKQPLVPYLSTKQYDGLPFESYPSREGYQALQSLKNEDQRKATAFLQRWLYYGLLSEFFGPEHLNRFVCRGPRAAHGEYYVDSSPLLEFRDAVAKSQRRHLLGCIYTATKAFSYITQETDLLDYNMRLSFNLLEDELTNAVSGNMARPINEAGYNAYLWDRPEVPKWCLYYRTWIDREFSVSSAYFISQCTVPLAELSHVSCDRQGRRATQIPEALYDKHVRRHVEHGCHCNEFNVDEEALSDIIKAGKVPLVDWTYTYNHRGEQSVEFELLVYEPGTSYVAISHVWSDGLGNQNKNGLYMCQMMRIRQNLHDITGNAVRKDDGPKTLPFWMDTLCCPVRDPESRKKTIAKMNEIYRNAAYVLVLDSYIAQKRVQDVTDLEMCMRVLISPWMMRLWTLQEANATKALFVALQNSMIYITMKMTSLLDDKTLPRGVLSDLQAQIFSLNIGRSFQLVKSGNRPPLSDLNLWQCLMTALHRRRTSKSEDEAVCIAGLTSLDVAQALDFRGQDRMTWLYDHLPPFPPSIIFLEGPRLEKRGYRWAPRSLLGKPHGLASSTKDGAPASKLTNTGLLVSYEAMLFCKEKIASFESTKIKAIRTPDGRWFYAYAENGVNFETLLTPYAQGRFAGHKLVIVVEDASESYSKGVLASVSPTESTKMARRQRANICRIALVTLKLCTSGQAELFNEGISDNNSWGFDFKEHMNQTEYVPVQEWILD